MKTIAIDSKNFSQQGIHAIDRMPGFIRMEVLKPLSGDDNYLIVSHWENSESFKAWQGSTEFLEGHRRRFEDIRKAKEEGRKPSLFSDFKMYLVLAE